MSWVKKGYISLTRDKNKVLVKVENNYYVTELQATKNVLAGTVEFTDLMFKEEVKWRHARTKPIVVEVREPNAEVETIVTREGELKGYRGQDYIIRGLGGDYPIKKEIFDKTFEWVNP